MIEFENLKFANSIFEEEYKEAFEEFLKSGSYILGPKLTQFETEFARYCQTAHCVGVGSGLDALKLALEVENFPTGSEVIVPANTFIATIIAVFQAGLRPVLAEPDIETYTLNPSIAEELISPQTKAIIPVHLYGKMCDMDKIVSLAKKYNLIIIEDCAQSHGAEFRKQKAGSIGHYGAFSFYPVKGLGALGDGGAITTSRETYKNLKKLRNYGSEVKYNYDLIGHNSRLDELQAAFLSVKLKKLDLITAHKRKLAALYFNHLSNDYIKPKLDENFLDVYHLFVVRHKKRDLVRDYLLKNKIETAVHYPVSPYKQQAISDLFVKKNYPVTDLIHDTVFSLPISFSHKEEDILRVCEVMNRF